MDQKRGVKHHGKLLSLPAYIRWILGATVIGILIGLVLAPTKPWNFEPPESGRWRLSEYIAVYSYWAAALNCLVLLGLALTASWWAAPSRNIPAATPTTPRWFWPFVLAAMIFCGASAAQRMNYGLAHDEDYSARRTISGSYKLTDEGQVVSDRLSWSETVFYYRKPNNHPLNSVLARVCVEISRLVIPGESWHMREWILRIPAWIAGVSGVVLLALLLRELNRPRAGILAAWLLALHPWYIRYASEARGYAMLMAFIPLCLIFWLWAVRTNAWRWWIAFGLTEFALVYSYPGGAYVLVVLNALTLFMLFRTQLLRRWFTANCLAGMLAVQLMLPLVPQLGEYMENDDESRHPLPTDWYQNTAAYFFTGASWNKTKTLDSPHPELRPMVAGHPVAFGVLLAAMGGLAILGTGILFAKGRPESPIIAATLLFPAFLSLAVAVLNTQWLFEWYLIYLLPGLAVVVATGAAFIGQLFAKRLSWRGMAFLPGLLVTVGFGFFTQPVRAWYCARPIESVKRSALIVRETLAPNDPRHAERLTGNFLGKPWYYDPHSVHLKTPDDLLALMRRADAEGKPLFITAPHPWAVAFNVPMLWRLFNEAGLFTDYVTVLGFDKTNTRLIARYAPGAVQNFDFNAFRRGRDITPDAELPPLEFPGKPKIIPITPEP